MGLALALVLAGCADDKPSIGSTGTQAEPQARAQAPEAQARTPLTGPVAPADVAVPPAAAQATASGLRSVVLRPGRRLSKPDRHDKVEIHFTGWTSDGVMFETTTDRGAPSFQAVKEGAAGFREALQLMTTGEKRRVWIPAALAYRGRGGKPDGSVVYDIELVRIHEGVAPLAAPQDLLSPPPDALTTASGLTYRVLQRGDSPGERPRPQDDVEMHYTGWTLDGRVFDSSVARQVPVMRSLRDLMPGWSQALQLMREGDRLRLWIPAELARTGLAGQPHGTLVMDVQLLEVHRRAL